MSFLRQKPRINRTLISLKVLVFFVLSGISILHVLNASKPHTLGLNFKEYRLISIVAPLVSIIGPIIVGPLADRLAARNANKFGRTLRLLIAACLLCAALIYSCLYFVPQVRRIESFRPKVTFGCDDKGAMIFQESCAGNASCHQWREEQGSLNLTRCTYSCQDPNEHENLYKSWLEVVPTALPSTEHSSEFDYNDPVTESLRDRLYGAGEVKSSESSPRKVYVEPPHLCLTEKNELGESVVTKCHVYTKDTSHIVVNGVLSSEYADNITELNGWCQYPLDGFKCHIPVNQSLYMQQIKRNKNCKPIIECSVIDPYDSKDSLLAGGECMVVTGNLYATIGGYAAVRFLGGIFVLAAFTLLNTAIIIAVRETSEGRGEVCRQYVWGAIGFVLVFSPLDLLYFQNAPNLVAENAALLLMIVLFVGGIITAICATQMPLSPPEWWWHTKTGMLVYPMSAIRRYRPEIMLLTVVALLFGTFWSSIHSYLFWTFTDVNAIAFAGVLLIFVLFFNVDKFVEYCGHSNVFIAGFTLFIVRFAALSTPELKWLTIALQLIEPGYICIVWITIMLYMRHAMPRKLTATGQAIAVVAFLGVGKSYGAMIGFARDAKYPQESSQTIHECLALLALVIALVYFVVYNLILAPRYAAKSQHLEELISRSASQTISNTASTGGAHAHNGNGTGAGAGAGAGVGASAYSPLRVYHNERGKKGQFRY